MTRKAHLSATVYGAGLNDVLSGTSRYGWRLPYPEATVYVPRVPRQPSTTWEALTSYLAGDPVAPTTRNGHLYTAEGAATSGSGEPTWPTGRAATVADGGVTWQEAGADITYDDVLTVAMGAGTNNVDRFYGYVRRLDFSLWPRMVGVVGHGRMVRAAMFENSDDPRTIGGLAPLDLIGAATGTDAAFVKAALTRALVPFTAGNILGTGLTFGTRATPQTFLWRAGTQYLRNILLYQAKGESALDYIHRWDEMSAVFTDATSPAGFFRTYETTVGVFRSLIGGRPRGVTDFTFTEGSDADILAGSSQRSYPLANRVFVTGFDPDLGTGAVSNAFSTTLQGSNPFMPDSEEHTYVFGSPFIEWALESDGGVGMNCERVANALKPDVNRETVTLRFTSGRDDLINPGATALVQAVGGLPDRLGIGEPLWVDEVATAASEAGVFTQDLACTGGGLPDSFTPAPAG